MQNIDAILILKTRHGEMARHMATRLTIPLLCMEYFLASASSFVSAVPTTLEDEQTHVFRRMNHLIVNESQVVVELSTNPHPFLDWGLVCPGHVEYLNKHTGEILPLNDPHSLENPDDIRAVPFAVATGVKIRVQAPSVNREFVEILKRNFPWENSEIEVNTLIFDDSDKTYRVWYKVAAGMAYAESKDFELWNKPLRSYTRFEAHSETNLLGIENLEEVLTGHLQDENEAKPGASGAFFIDPSAPPNERFKTTFLAHTKTPHYDSDGTLVDQPISAMTGPTSTVIFGATSSDGMSWRIIPKPLCYHDADTQTVTKFDNQLNKYVAYTRLYELSHRTIGLVETDDFKVWPLPVNVMTPGPTDGPSVDYYANAFSFYPGLPQLRLIFCLAYNRADDDADVRLATSRNGRVFHFTPEKPIISASRHEKPGHGFLSPKPGLVRLPDGKMLLVYGAWKMPHKFPRYHVRGAERDYREFCAEWGPDRLSALESPERGEFSTVPLLLKGNKIVLNMSAERTGKIEVEVRDEDYRLIPGRAFADADLLHGDRQSQIVTWQGESDLNEYRNRTIYLRFRLKAANLYSISAID